MQEETARHTNITVQWIKTANNMRQEGTVLILSSRRQGEYGWTNLPRPNDFRQVLKVEKTVFSFVICVYSSVRLPAYIRGTLTGRISEKFDIGNFYEDLSKKFKFAYNRALHMKICVHFFFNV